MGAFQPTQPREGCFGRNAFGSLLSNSFQISSWARGTNIIPRPGWRRRWGGSSQEKADKHFVQRVTEPGHTRGINKYLLNMYSLSSSEPARAVRMLRWSHLGKGPFRAFQDGRNFLGERNVLSFRWQVDSPRFGAPGDLLVPTTLGGGASVLTKSEFALY